MYQISMPFIKPSDIRLTQCQGRTGLGMTEAELILASTQCPLAAFHSSSSPNMNVGRLQNTPPQNGVLWTRFE